MAVHTYFLGANTPEGFFSRYDGLFQDDRIKKLLIIKGGPGCGKSTLMRRVGEAAQKLGCETEELLCSSDPNSLDGLVIPTVGLALVDGTAPHILEPPLCGCGAEYLDLGSCYDTAKLTDKKEQLFALKTKNAACYPSATACFSAAAAAQQALNVPAKPKGIETITVALGSTRKKRQESGRRTKRFYAALSPEGAVFCELPCRTVWTLRDNFGVAAEILSAVADSFTAAGYDIIIGSLPLTPAQTALVIIPELSTAYVAVTDQFSYPGKTAGQYDLDALTLPELSAVDALHAQKLLHLRAEAVREGLSFLKEAKAYHDELENACRNAVDFDRVNEKTETVKQLLTDMTAVI